jgi:glutathione synthase/RimK-type ligase-like ATP-grasp enzyme
MHARWPHLVMFPDPRTIYFYNDKYRQYLFLQSRRFSMPDTIPLTSDRAVETADASLGYPMVLKNRYGAGGGSVMQVKNRDELVKYYRMSKLDLWNPGAVRHYIGVAVQREFYWHLIKNKRMKYPFYSPPLLAQRFLKTDRDVRVVVGGRKVVEAHWRIQASPEQWKVNIDGGGIGEWSAFPQGVLDLSVQVAHALDTDGWLALDILKSEDQFYITEFSPVWHHYLYKEKDSFIYKDDYNVDVPLEVSLDLERIIVESLIGMARNRDSAQSSP